MRTFLRKQCFPLYMNNKGLHTQRQARVGRRKGSELTE